MSVNDTPATVAPRHFVYATPTPTRVSATLRWGRRSGHRRVVAPETESQRGGHCSFPDTLSAKTCRSGAVFCPFAQIYKLHGSVLWCLNALRLSSALFPLSPHSTLPTLFYTHTLFTSRHVLLVQDPRARRRCDLPSRHRPRRPDFARQRRHISCGLSTPPPGLLLLIGVPDYHGPHRQSVDLAH